MKVATFGPWLQEVGLGALTRALRRAGHRLDVSDCPEPLAAGCQLQATLRGGAEAKIQVLFSAPPRTAARQRKRGVHRENSNLRREMA